MEEIDWKSIAAALAESLEDFLEHYENIGEFHIHPESLPNLVKVYHALKNYYDATHHHEVSSETVGEWKELH